MQQNNVTLTNELNTAKYTVESYLKKIAQPIQEVQSQAFKIAPSFKSLKTKKGNCFEPP